MTTAIAESPAPIKRTHPIVLENQAADARANVPAKTWTAAPLRKPDHPAVAAQKAEAAEVAADAAATAARAASMETAANVTGQRIASLEREKTELMNRLAAAESRDCKSELARNEARFFDLYGKFDKTRPEIDDLNTCIESFSWLPQLEKRLPVLAKKLRSRVAEIEAELASLTAGK